MQSLPSAAKLFCDQFVNAACIVIVCVSFFSAVAVAQVYRIQTDGSLIYQPRYVNPNRQPNRQQLNGVPQIYPGQIINGERVVAASVTALPLNRPEVVNPPAPISNPDPQSPEPIQPHQQSLQSQRPDVIPKTNFPIPAGPSLQSEPDAESASPAAIAQSEVINKTPLNLKSSIVKEEKGDPSQPKMRTVQPPALDAPNDELPNERQDELAADPPAIDEDILAEIKQIRDQLGGGISETLKDVDPMPSFGSIEITEAEAATDRELSPDELFNEELRSVMSEKESNRAAIFGQSQSPGATVRLGPTETTTYADRIEKLRSCARELEQLAGRLETIEAYEHADQIRRQAAEIWTTARNR